MILCAVNIVDVHLPHYIAEMLLLYVYFSFDIEVGFGFGENIGFVVV